VTHADLAALFAYPDAAGVAGVRAALDAVPGLGAFADRVRAGPPEDLEEQFTRTFDINPLVSLEVGWHLYGEDYSRGAFLVRMRGLMREHGVEESGELPDHLTHVLVTLGRMESEEADGLARGFVLPAVAKILAALDGKDNDYRLPLEAVQRFLRERHGRETEAAEMQPPPYAQPCGGCGLKTEARNA